MIKNSDTTKGAPNRQSAIDRRAALEERFPIWTRQTLASHFTVACEQYTDRPFIHIADTTTTYGEIWENARQYANAIIKLDVNMREHTPSLLEITPSKPSVL